VLEYDIYLSEIDLPRTEPKDRIVPVWRGDREDDFVPGWLAIGLNLGVSVLPDLVEDPFRAGSGNPDFNHVVFLLCLPAGFGAFNMPT
jgi:hypothetical protein